MIVSAWWAWLLIAFVLFVVYSLGGVTGDARGEARATREWRDVLLKLLPLQIDPKPIDLAGVVPKNTLFDRFNTGWTAWHPIVCSHCGDTVPKGGTVYLCRQTEGQLCSRCHAKGDLEV